MASSPAEPAMPGLMDYVLEIDKRKFSPLASGADGAAARGLREIAPLELKLQ